jgi:hypothetical protein
MCGILRNQPKQRLSRLPGSICVLPDLLDNEQRLENHSSVKSPNATGGKVVKREKYALFQRDAAKPTKTKDLPFIPPSILKQRSFRPLVSLIYPVEMGLEDLNCLCDLPG